MKSSLVMKSGKIRDRFQDIRKIEDFLTNTSCHLVEPPASELIILIPPENTLFWKLKKNLLISNRICSKDDDNTTTNPPLQILNSLFLFWVFTPHSNSTIRVFMWIRELKTGKENYNQLDREPHFYISWIFMVWKVKKLESR